MNDGIYEITGRDEFTIADRTEYKVEFVKKDSDFTYAASTEFDNLKEAGYDKVKKLAERNTHVVIRDNDVVAFVEMIK